jgi:hypothetical protein
VAFLIKGKKQLIEEACCKILVAGEPPRVKPYDDRLRGFRLSLADLTLYEIEQRRFSGTPSAVQSDHKTLR